MCCTYDDQRPIEGSQITPHSSNARDSLQAALIFTLTLVNTYLLHFFSFPDYALPGSVTMNDKAAAYLLPLILFDKPD